MSRTTSRIRQAAVAGAMAAIVVGTGGSALALPPVDADPILPPTTIPPPTTVPPAPVVPPVFTGSPRYKLEAISFRADDESGIDWTGSDEPVFVFTSVDGAGSQRSVAQKFGDVDSGESRSFTTARCLVATCASGVAGPLALTTQLVESDGGSAEEIRGKVSKAVTALQWVAKVFGWDASFLDGAIEDYLVGVFADDLMGSANLVWEQWELAQALPVVGATYTEVIHLGERGGDLPSWIDNPPDYTLRLRITRMADTPPVLTS